MQRELYEVEKDRFDLKDSSLYHLQGTWPKDHKPEAVLDGEKLPAAISAQERVSALERFKDLDLVNGERVQMEICLPDLEGKKKLVVYAVKGEKRIRWFSVPAAQLYRKQGKPQYFIESIEVEAGEKICRVRGWAAFNSPPDHTPGGSQPEGNPLRDHQTETCGCTKSVPGNRDR